MKYPHKRCVQKDVKHLPTSFITLQILTKDSVTVFVNAIMYYKVKVHCTVLYCVLYCTTR